jgi:RNA-binding protein
LQEVGEVLHLANSGRVIVRLLKKGPVAKPYASAIPLTKNITRYTGKKVFALADSPAKKYKKIRRKKR